jgi:alginate O-acetyltransferase complex protein AlgI
MPFHSPAFLLLLLPTLLLYYTRRTERWQHAILFISSFAFYWFAGVRDLSILVGTILANFAISYLPARRAMVVGVVFDLGVLAFFKYRWFLWGMVATVPADAVAEIPLGISFYVFQLIGYHVDRGRGEIEREPSLARLFLYVLFFPHHQAGPIMRPAAFLPQFRGEKQVDLDQIAAGARWLLWGLFLKTMADQLAGRADLLFAQSPGSMLDGWKAAITFTIQIYGDFGGYSHMAVGLGYLFGYVMDRNFRQPYLAVSPSEFWQRWHITLSSWLRDYLYVPLGGNRLGTTRTYFNLLATMVLGGLWHGASTNFIVWGLLHGALLCVFRALPLEKRSRQLSWVLTQLAVVFFWVPFRAPGYARTVEIWRAMVGWGVPAGPRGGWATLAALVAAFLALHVLEEFVLGTRPRAERSLALWLRVPPIARGALLSGAFLGTMLFLVEGTTFIYFRF